MAKDITQEEAQALVGNGEYASKFDEATGGATATSRSASTAGRT